ncbi:uncharacterized protein LOC114364793 [Ostrinia furnacalis]|nr:uncharacterized protein LOC114364793 [Ostrinia furnacalis]
MTNPYNKHIWYGWDAPPEAKGAWAQWMAKYQQAIAGKGGPYNPSIHDKPYGQDVKDWPADWGVLGPPRDGMMPPPWAYVPKRSGKPALCYDPPLYGDCSSNIYRYGYNSFTEECLQFSYSGCGGNMNNFVEWERCRDTCMGSPKFGCNDDSKIPIDTIVGARRCGYQDDVPNDYLSVRDYPGSK